MVDVDDIEIDIVDALELQHLDDMVVMHEMVAHEMHQIERMVEIDDTQQIVANDTVDDEVDEVDEDSETVVMVEMVEKNIIKSLLVFRSIWDLAARISTVAAVLADAFIAPLAVAEILPRAQRFRFVSNITEQGSDFPRNGAPSIVSLIFKRIPIPMRRLIF